MRRSQSGEEKERSDHAEEIREEDADLADQNGGAGLLFELLEVQFHADDKHEEANPDLAQEAKRAQGRRREDKLKQVRP